MSIEFWIGWLVGFVLTLGAWVLFLGWQNRR
jgi:hypothetical protein